MINKNNTIEREFSALSIFILWCSCADREILKTCSNSVVMKYQALGFLILVPAIFAIPSMTFFVKMAFFPTDTKAIYPAIGFALLWSWIVLTFDRYFVINKGGFLKAMGRLIIAGLFSYVIAEPLVVQMFYHNLQKSIIANNRIEKESLNKLYEGKIAATEVEIGQLNKKITERDNINLLAEQSPEMKELQSRISDKQAEIKQAQSEYSDEVAGASSSRSGKSGVGPVAISIQEKIDTLNADLATLNDNLSQAKTQQQSVLNLKKQMLLKDESNLQNIRQRNLQLVDQKTAKVVELKQEQAKAVAELEKVAVTDFLTLYEELDRLAFKHPSVRLQQVLFSLLLFTLDVFAVMLKLLSDNDDELIHKQATLDFANRVIEGVKQQAYSETTAQRVALQIRNMMYGLNREAAEQLWQHRLDKKAMLVEILRKHSQEDNRFHEWFIKSPQYNDAIMKEYLQVAEMTFAQIVAELCKEEKETEI
jgi:Domain of unknown function (DUF4407)